MQTKSIRFSPLAAAQPLTILSRPETLKAISSRRACWIAKSRDAYPFPYVRTDNASLICFRQRIAQFSSSQTAGASLRLVAEVTPVGDVEAVVGCVSSAGRNRERVPVAMRETSQNAGKTGVALADCLLRSSLASHAPDGQGGLEPPPTGVESGGSG